MDKNNQPLVSVLIPLYNQEKYFGACMKSVDRQTYKNLEIVVVNDGSTDRSPQMAHDWAARDPRVKVVDKENEGLAFARRDGLLAATGDYITFLDSDDTLPRRAIEILVTHALETGADLVSGGFDKMVGFIKRHNTDSNCSFPLNQLVTQPELFDKYFIGFYRNDVFPVSACGKIYRKSVVDKAYQETELYSPDIPFMAEDMNFSVHLFPFLHSMYRISDTVYNYRYGGGTYGFNRHFTQLLLLSDKRLHLLDKFNYSEGYKHLYAEYVACFYFQAAQLIHFKKADKQGVIDFFKDEMAHRELMPGLLSYYRGQQNNGEGVKALLDCDYDAMYEHACSDAKRIFCSFKYRLSEFLVKLLS